MKGGARVRSGPPADPNAVQPEQFIELPATHEGAAPPWPITPKPTTLELATWEREWRRPEADQWEKRSLQVEVAIYVRTLIRAARPGATVALLSERRRQADSLGLTIGGYRAAKFTSQVDPTPKQRQRATGTDGTPARWKPEVIDGTG